MVKDIQGMGQSVVACPLPTLQRKLHQQVHRMDSTCRGYWPLLQGEPHWRLSGALAMHGVP